MKIVPPLTSELQCPPLDLTHSFLGLLPHQTWSLLSWQRHDEQPRQQSVPEGERPAPGWRGLSAELPGQSAAESTAHAPASADHDPRARAALPAQECLHLAHS